MTEQKQKSIERRRKIVARLGQDKPATFEELKQTRFIYRGRRSTQGKEQFVPIWLPRGSNRK
jgi:hypothetical protein